MIKWIGYVIYVYLTFSAMKSVFCLSFYAQNDKSDADEHQQ